MALSSLPSGGYSPIWTSTAPTPQAHGPGSARELSQGLTPQHLTPQNTFRRHPKTGAVLISDRVASLVDSHGFQASIGFVILLNALVIGLETDDASNTLWGYVEVALLLIFAIELILRLYSHGRSFFASVDWLWNLFDFAIVVAGVIDTGVNILVLGWAGAFEKQSADQAHHHNRGIISILRMVRLLRILRIVRLIRMFPQLQMIAVGFAEAMSAVLWLTVMTCIVLYICAVALTRILGHPAKANTNGCLAGGQGGDDEIGPEAEASMRELDPFLCKRFGDIRTSMFTLFEIMVHPKIEEYRAVMDQSVYLKLFFILFVIVGSFAMVSLLTGIVSETMLEKSTLAQAKRDKLIERRRRFMTHMYMLFMEADHDGSGSLSKAEYLLLVPRIAESLRSEMGQMMTDSDLASAFDIVDDDGSGSIDSQEFLAAMNRMQRKTRAFDVMSSHAQMRRMHNTITDRVDQLRFDVDDGFKSIDSRIEATLFALRPHGTGNFSLLGAVPSLEPLDAPLHLPPWLQAAGKLVDGAGVTSSSASLSAIGVLANGLPEFK